MSFETITIVRQFPIINGNVQLPNNYVADKTAVPVSEFLTTIGGTINSLTARTGGARLAGSRFGVQEFIELPAATVDCCEVSSNETAETAKRTYDTDRPTDPDRPYSSPDPNNPGDECYCPTWWETIVLYIETGVTIGGGRGCCNSTLLPNTFYFYPSTENEYQMPTTSCTWYSFYDAGLSFYTLTVAFNPTTCLYYMTIYCDQTLAWAGTNNSNEPGGVYIQTGGCSETPPTITVNLLAQG